MVLVWSWRRKSEYLLLNFFLLTKCYHNMHHIFLQCHRWRNEDKGVLWILKRVGGMHVVDRGKYYLIQYHYCVTSLFDIALNWVTRPHMFQQTPSRYDWGGILLKNVTNILCKTHSKVLYNIAVVAAAAAETRCQARPPSEHSGNCAPIGRAAGHVTPPEPPVFSQTLIGNSWEEGPKFCKLFAHVLGEWKCTDLTIVWRTICG